MKKQRDKEILARYKAGEKVKDIAAAYGMSLAGISAIANKEAAMRRKDVTRDEILFVQRMSRKGLNAAEIAELMGVKLRRVHYIRHTCGLARKRIKMGDVARIKALRESGMPIKNIVKKTKLTHSRVEYILYRL